MVVNNITKLTSDEVLHALTTKIRKQQKSKTFLCTVFLALAVLLIILGYSQENSMYYEFGYVFLAFAFVYFGGILFSFFYAPKKVYKKYYELYKDGAIYSYTFKEQSFKVLAESHKKEKESYSYIAVKKIYEYEDKYEFKLSDFTFTISKSGFENSKMEDFFKKNIEKNKKKIILKIK